MNKQNNLLSISKNRKRLIKVNVKTNPHYGKSPNEFTINELINNGIINLDKPSGPTSHQGYGVVGRRQPLHRTQYLPTQTL